MDANSQPSPEAPRGAEPTILSSVTLIDGGGGPPLADAMVVVEGDRIAYAGPATGAFEGRPARRLDLAGKTVVPGLIETHTHACLEADMLGYLKNGITTVRFAGLAPADVAAMRRRIAAGEIPGPRILSCGPMVDGAPPAYPEWSVAVASPAEADETVTRLAASGEIDYLILTQRVTAPVMQAAIAAAHRSGLTVIGQTWAVDGKEAAELGIDELHNSSRVFASRDYPPDRLLSYTTIADRLALSGWGWATIDWEATAPIIDAMVEAGTAYCGMQVITQFQLGEHVEALEADQDFQTIFGEDERASFRQFVNRLQSTWSPADFDSWRVANDNRMEWMRRFRARGGQLLTGTDMQFGGIMLHHELGNLARLGMRPMDVIAAASAGNAAALRRPQLGRLAPGMTADLVVLNRSPEHDLGALRDVALVMRDGEIAWSAQAQPAPEFIGA